MATPFFDGLKLDLELRDFHPGEEADFLSVIDDALEKFYALGAEARRLASERVNRNCQEFLDAVADETDDWARDMLNIEDPAEVWRFVQPQTIAVCRGSSDESQAFVSIESNCDWEEEHALQLVYARGHTLSRVSAQDGHVED